MILNADRREIYVISINLRHIALRSLDSLLASGGQEGKRATREKMEYQILTPRTLRPPQPPQPQPSCSIRSSRCCPSDVGLVLQACVLGSGFAGMRALQEDTRSHACLVCNYACAHTHALLVLDQELMLTREHMQAVGAGATVALACLEVADGLARPRRQGVSVKWAHAECRSRV
jgi:hypothetical protein